jgi:hypothetical protein
MGECAYYMKVEFRTKRDATKAKPQFEKFIQECVDAHAIDDNEKLKEYLAGHPLVNEFATTLEKIDDIPDIGIGWESGQEDNVLCLVAYDNWHMANWTDLVEFIKTKFKARVVWDTEDEGCGGLDSLQLHDWEAMIKSLLKEKKILPTLIHIHPELDELIAQTLG